MISFSPFRPNAATTAAALGEPWLIAVVVVVVVLFLTATLALLRCCCCGNGRMAKAKVNHKYDNLEPLYN